MTLNISDLKTFPGLRTVIGSAPEGYQSFLLAQLAKRERGAILHVARDDRRMDAVAQAARFFAPNLDVLTFPAWDCLPYDRVSPNPLLASERMDTLSHLVRAHAQQPRLVITTVNALLQRILPRDYVTRHARSVGVGDTIDLEKLAKSLTDVGYARTGTVIEPGEFSVRGGLVDIFSPGSVEPSRVDLFGDLVETIRTFDPTTQRSTGRVERFNLTPVSEIPLDSASVERFRAGYTALFGVPSLNDVLYAAVSEGRRHSGVEHWLPLFFERLETMFDYFPDALVTLDNLAEEARDARIEMINEYYAARRNRADEGGEDSVVYRPLAPDRLYCSANEWDRALKERQVIAFSTFARPEADDVIDAGAREGRNFFAERSNTTGELLDAVQCHLEEVSALQQRVLITAYSAGSADRLSKLLHDHGVGDILEVSDWEMAQRLLPGQVGLAILGVERGFEAPDLVIISEQDILGERIARPQRRTRRAENFIAEVADLNPGDLVIHIDHGIGRFEGLNTIEISEAPHDCLLIVYAGDDRLFIPVENIEVLSRYGSEHAEVELDRLGGAQWQSRKARIKKRLKDMADELIRIAATRATRRVDSLSPPEHIYDEFCARFPYHETEDQTKAISDVLDDLSSGSPMDRLICGDVGYGKTEVALRSAFITAMAGKQVAVVAPTTLLARQHVTTFSARFSGLPVKVGHLSRLVPPKQVREVKKGIAGGDIDIVIGTHALLQKGIEFRDLGLVIVDEEQHFGVAHKEQLKKLRTNVHVLTLTATPIPRTLQLALAGVRELSLISTPPVDRLAIRTFILPFDPVIVREAIIRERYRGGQTYYVCPRIADLDEASGFLQRELPEVKFAIVHGRLPAKELDRVMTAFYDGAYDVLLCTNIIESGIDIASVNTLIVYRAHMFGLSQLYQIRGRIGRSKQRGYAYLTIPPHRVPTANAERRLEVMQALDGLGAGFSVASHDMDIRGAGNLLGEEQSGHIREVGLELYQTMLEDAVAAARQDTGETAISEETWSPQIQLGTAVLIPDSYVTDLSVRMGLYRRLAQLTDRRDIDAFGAEMIDRFGPLPDEVEHLLKTVGIKQACHAAGVERIEAGPRGATLSFRNDSFSNPAGLVSFIGEQAGSTKLRPDHKLVYLRVWETGAQRLAGVQQLMDQLAAIAIANDAPQEQNVATPVR